MLQSQAWVEGFVARFAGAQKVSGLGPTGVMIFPALPPEALQVWLPCHVCVMRWQRAERLGLRPVFWPVDIWMIDSLTLDKVPTEGGWVLAEACRVRTP